MCGAVLLFHTDLFYGGATHNMRTHDETSREAQRLNITKPWVQVGLLLRNATCSYHTWHAAIIRQRETSRHVLVAYMVPMWVILVYNFLQRVYPLSWIYRRHLCLASHLEVYHGLLNVGIRWLMQGSIQPSKKN
jgi:hypothetical protein